MHTDSARDWAWSEFSGVELGDSRRPLRLVEMAAAAARRPSGLVSEVFEADAQRQGAYDFLESPLFCEAPIVDAIGNSCAARCAEEQSVYVAMDGTSLAVVDHENTKGLGHVGTYRAGARGLHVITAIALSSRGVPIGVAHLEWWDRLRYKRLSSYRPPRERESQKWCDCVEAVMGRYRAEAPTAKLCFLADRDADDKAILIPLMSSGHNFIVRSQYDRRLQDVDGERQYLREKLRKETPVGGYTINVPRRDKTRKRQARVIVHCATVTILTQNKWNHKVVPLELNVVCVRETGPVPAGAPRLEWRLLTNLPIDTMAQALQVVDGYCLRWRSEDFHRAWKSGVCNVEKTQLRGSQQVRKWATILAAVAARAERLKHLARNNADESATRELTNNEIKALRMLKERRKKRTEILPDRTPTLGEAVLWIAQLGGYINQSGQGPPGTVTIQRGLDRLAPAAELLDVIADSEK